MALLFDCNMSENFGDFVGRRKKRGNAMSFTKSEIIPTAFWVGFLVLGLVTNLGGRDKHPSRQAKAQEALSYATGLAAATKSAPRAAEVVMREH